MSFPHRIKLRGVGRHVLVACVSAVVAGRCQDGIRVPSFGDKLKGIGVRQLTRRRWVRVIFGRALVFASLHVGDGCV